MRKTTVLLLAVIVMALLLPLAAHASQSAYQYVLDDAHLLTDGQRLELEARASAMSANYRCDVRIVTVEDFADYGYQDIEEFTYGIYRELDFGYGIDRDCVLFVLSIGGRDYDLRAWGNRAETAFTFYGIDSVLDNHVLPLLGGDNFNSAFSVFLDRAEVYFELAEEGTPFERGADPSASGSGSGGKVAVVILVPLLISGIVCGIWASQMKTAKIARLADNYIPAGGFNLTGQGDVFLYRTTSRRKIEKSASSSSSGSKSSSGRGGSSGRSGKF